MKFAFGAVVLAAATLIAQGTVSPVGRMQPRIVPEGAYNWRGAATKALITSVWYPAAAGLSASEHFVGPPGSPLFRLGTWTDRAPRAEGRSR